MKVRLKNGGFYKKKIKKERGRYALNGICARFSFRNLDGKVLKLPSGLIFLVKRYGKNFLFFMRVLPFLVGFFFIKKENKKIFKNFYEKKGFLKVLSNI